MSEINYKEINERSIKLSKKIYVALANECIGVCLCTLASVTAMFLVSCSRKEGLKTENGAKLFYEDLLEIIKTIEQSIANYEKAN